MTPPIPFASILAQGVGYAKSGKVIVEARTPITHHINTGNWGLIIHNLQLRTLDYDRSVTARTFILKCNLITYCHPDSQQQLTIQEVPLLLFEVGEPLAKNSYFITNELMVIHRISNPQRQLVFTIESVVAEEDGSRREISILLNTLISVHAHLVRL